MATMNERSRRRVAQNFVDRYGEQGLRELLRALRDAQSGQVIADRFNVSRERVRQWKNAFGQSVMVFHVYPEVAELVGEVPSPRREGPSIVLEEPAVAAPRVRRTLSIGFTEDA